MLGDASQTDEWLWTRPSPCSAPQRRCGVRLERRAHAKAAGQNADDEDDPSERQHIVGFEYYPPREVALDIGNEQAPNMKPVNPSASACCTIMATMVRSGAPISFSMAIWRSFSMVMV